MSRDYTRWNRAGLRRFRYVDATAATYLEDLRRSLGRRLPQWAAAAAEVDVELEAGGIAERAALERAIQARLREQYEAPSGELAWELARSCVRACHVLGEHIDAYANEGFVETATQWDSVRRLVAMLDHYPQPPASASTFLVLRSREGARGRLEVGDLQVSHAPADGGDPIVFENLEGLEVDARLDALRPAGWNRSPFMVDLRDMIWRPPDRSKLGVGSEVIAVDEARELSFMTRVERVELERLELERAPDEDWPVADSVLWTDPQASRACHLRGPRVLRLHRGHGLAVGDLIAWFDEGWGFNEIEAIDAVSARVRYASISLLEDEDSSEVDAIPSAGEVLGRARSFGPATGPSPLTLPLELTALAWRGAETLEFTTQIDAWTTPVTPQGMQHPTHREAVEALAGKRLFAITDEFTAKTSVLPATEAASFEGTPGSWQTGQWFIAEQLDGTRTPVRLRELATASRSFEALFEPSADELLRVHGPFMSRLRPDGWDRDTTLVSGGRLLVAALPTTGVGLRGRRIVLRWPTGAHAATLRGAQGVVVSFTPPLPRTAGARRFELELHANVVLAGHGARMPAQTLASGDATRPNQSFVLDVFDLAFDADARGGSGVRAALELEIDGRRWREIDSLRDAGPADEVFVTRVREDKTLTLITGDGHQGRRVPTGVNNVRVGYRRGSGLAGNLGPGLLTELARPHVLVEEVLSPLAASGGNDMDDLALLGTSAAPTVLTLGRAVSLDDFARLAGGHASVWQARAISRPPARGRERVEVVVVPAGGGELGDSQRQLLEDYLSTRTGPDVVVGVVAHRPMPVDLHVRLAVDPAFADPLAVLGSVRSALELELSARRRGIGQALRLAEVVEIIETTPGVLHSGVVLDGDLELRARAAKRDELLVLGQLLIEHGADTTRAVLSSSKRRAIEERSVLALRGVGPECAQALAALEPRVSVIHELAALKLETLGDDFMDPPHEVRRLRAKAALILSQRLPEALLSAAPQLSIAALLAYPIESLAARYGLELDQARLAHDAGRRLQACLDDVALADINLAALADDPQLSLAAVVAPQSKQALLGRRNLLELAGVGEALAQALADPPLAKTTIAELARLDPADACRRSPALAQVSGATALWELRTKARLVLDARWPGPTSMALSLSSIASLIESEDHELAAAGDLTLASVARLRALLDRLELSLDLAALTELTLEQFTDP